MIDHQADHEEGTEPVSGKDTEKERRRYFRIEDEIILFFREIAPDDIPDNRSPRDFPLDSFALSASLDLLTQESRKLLRKIERDSPEVGDFLKVLERKIDLVARSFLSYEANLAEQSTQRVSLSASGLSFEVEKPYAPGKVLEIKMVLHPDLVGLIAYGRIVYCKKNPPDSDLPYQISVDFVGLRDSDRELLIRHVVRRQLQQLRNRKRPSE
ncbi:type IV pilus assembly PilZ [Methylocaldum marinum]|uniref:Type IV pilus assembly PilZ n=1 Tax=Methylocaldum marinum TaxID=1432792 RepID=A0A250L021_9GAMM|nr:PilZ domain-containing protein [Methylocaldum marinum]BBA37268.1 type IV pilus assembly PilZ [Methylocaldum marinum]